MSNTLLGGIGALPRMKKVEFWAKEWFHKSAGNSYFAIKVYVNDELIGESPMQYGYGRAYEQEGMNIMRRKGYLRGVKASYPSSYFKGRMVKYIGHLNSVKTQKELKDFVR